MELLETKRIRTTSYHPVANGLVERFHRQLKAALRSHPNPINWVDSLPMVLLGIHTALKDDLHVQCSAAELVYGTTLRLSTEFFHSSKTDCVNPVTYVQKLKLSMQQLQATPTRYHFHLKVHVSDDLSHCTHLHVT